MNKQKEIQKDSSVSLLDSPEDFIAIIAMTGRFPGADTVEQFWDNLKNGRESITHFSADELAKLNLEDRLKENPRYIGADGRINGIEMFDAEFFNIHPREAELLDPQHRLFLECCWEAMELAGYIEEPRGKKFGVYGSANLSSYLMRNVMSNPELKESATSFQTMICNDKDFIATRAAYKMNFTGPCLSVATLCSSSFVAIHYACQDLLNYQCDLALAGAVSLQATANEAFFYQEGGIGDPDGHCRAFDADAGGTVSGNGLGLVVLKRLDEAIADGDFIHAVIRGTGINNDGQVKYSYTAPSIKGQAEVIAAAQEMAGVHPETITYIEAHGTGTRLGDPIEIEALTKAFRRKTDKTQYCAVGSVKTNIGHLVNAGGVASLIKTVEAMKNRQIPASLNFRKANPEINFKDSPFFVNTALREWETTGFPRRAGVSSFGIGGTNVHMVVEEAPPPEPSGPAREWQLFPVSAKSEKALAVQLANLKTFMEKNPGINPADAAFTLQTGRREMDYRHWFVCRNREEAVAYLAEPADSHFHRTAGTPPLLYFFCDVQDGSQSQLFDLYRTEAEFAAIVDFCVEKIPDTKQTEKQAVLYHALNNGNPVTDPLLAFILQYAAGKLLNHWGMQPQFLSGAGTGAWAAAVLANVFTLEAGLAAIHCRSSGCHADLRLSAPGIPLIAPATGKALPETVIGSQAYWMSQLEKPETDFSGLSASAETEEMILLCIDADRKFAASLKNRNKNMVVFPGEKNVLETMGQLWVLGAGPDWNNLHAHEKRHRIPLPTYPFQRKRYWIDMAAGKKEIREIRHTELQTHPRPALSVMYKAPATELEKAVAAIWQRNLGIDKIGIDDNFFELGGDSLTAVNTIKQIEAELEKKVPAESLYRTPDIGSLVKLLAEEDAAAKQQQAEALQERKEALSRRNNLLRQRRI